MFDIHLFLTPSTNLVPLKVVILTLFRVGWVAIILILSEVEWGLRGLKYPTINLPYFTPFCKVMCFSIVM